MDSAPNSEIRLAELIWRTIKLRASLLVLALVVLLIVWSSLVNGNQEAHKIDVAFCGDLVNWNNDLQQTLSTQLNDSRESVPKTPKQKPLIMSKEDRCGAANSRTWIEIVRMTDL
jgi:hypothetical protein